MGVSATGRIFTHDAQVSCLHASTSANEHTHTHARKAVFVMTATQLLTLTPSAFGYLQRHSDASPVHIKKVCLHMTVEEFSMFACNWAAAGRENKAQRPVGV
jgi:hypothetical protein